ncbi:MAG: hypothetical protein L3K00_07790 [Thermoplasmata archaeon]|nr:hypothetical protein [Thermoplasmata archaeon]
MVGRKKAKPTASRPSPRAPKSATEPKFQGRDPSPVLDKYPPKDPSLTLRGRPTVPDRHGPVMPPPAVPKPAVAAPSGIAPAPGPARPLISLVRPFDVDEFAQLLGETMIRLEVPRDDLTEVLRRVCDFMGFGIYVYSVKVRPAKDELLSRFVLELQRVDFDGTTGDWVPFEEKGRSDSPFGPSGHRT